MAFSEQELLSLVASVFQTEAATADILVGIGDDAAVVRGKFSASDHNRCCGRGCSL
jgi:hypothetical protein